MNVHQHFSDRSSDSLKISCWNVNGLSKNSVFGNKLQNSDFIRQFHDSDVSIMSEMGDSRKYPYPTMGGMSILTPPCRRKFQNAYPPLALRIPKSLTPPLLRNFPLLFQTLWNSCLSA